MLLVPSSGASQRNLIGPRKRLQNRSSGFTILELLLATACATLLLSALYISFDMTIRQTQSARDAASTEDLVRGVFQRISVDIAGTLGPQPPNSGGLANQQLMINSVGGTSSSSSSSTSSTSGSSASGSSGASSTAGSSSSSASGTTILGSGANIAFQCGVIGGYQGNPNMMILFTSRVPDVFTTFDSTSLAQLYNQGGATGSSISQFPADLRRVVYWVGSNGGLYRYETPWVTGIETWPLLDLPIPDDSGVCIAKEVTQATFEYWDPVEETWEQSWDGTGTSSPPFSLTMGPPTAVRVTLTFSFNNPRGGNKITSTTAQTFPIYPAAGPVSQVLYDPTSSSSSSSSSGGGSGNTVGASTVGAKTVGGGGMGGK